MRNLLFRIQQYVAITEVEAKAFSIVLLLIFLGLGVQYAQANWMMPALEVPPLLEPVAGTSPRAGMPDTLIVSDTTKSDTTTTADTSPAGTLGETCGIDLNAASALELQALPGIGPKLAERIILHRDRNGVFRSPADLVKVKGIGAKTFVRLEPLICTGSTGQRE